MAWARTYLKKYGFLDNSTRGVWTLTPLARNKRTVNPKQVLKSVREMHKSVPHKQANQESQSVGSESNFEDVQDEEGWQQELLHFLTREVSPDAFERLSQRLLRESGFVQVEVTGKSGDGGIDGKGIARIHGFMSFHVFFQCKRYQGAVSASAIRDFRGAMAGRADKGLVITTGTFSPAAKKEATRDGAQPIDLVDGEHLVEKLKEFGLGVKTEMIEKVTLDKEWFQNL
jgi:restriction system protein